EGAAARPLDGVEAARGHVGDGEVRGVELGRPPRRRPWDRARREPYPEDGELEAEMAPIDRVHVSRVVPPLRAVPGVRPVVGREREGPRKPRPRIAWGIAAQRLGDGQGGPHAARRLGAPRPPRAGAEGGERGYDYEGPEETAAAPRSRAHRPTRPGAPPPVSPGPCGKPGRARPGRRPSRRERRPRPGHPARSPPGASSRTSGG